METNKLQFSFDDVLTASLPLKHLFVFAPLAKVHLLNEGPGGLKSKRIKNDVKCLLL